jgi:hypothetical protein
VVGRSRDRQLRRGPCRSLTSVAIEEPRRPGVQHPGQDLTSNEGGNTILQKAQAQATSVRSTP